MAELPAMPEVRFYHICAALPGTGVRPDSTLSFLMLPTPGTDCGWRSDWKRTSEFPLFSADTWPRSYILEGTTTPSKRIEAALRSSLHSRWQVGGNWRLVWGFHKKRGTDWLLCFPMKHMFFLSAVLFSIFRCLSITLYLGTNGKLWDKSRLGGSTTLLSLLGPKICPA